MISGKQWVTLLFVYLLYLLFGGLIFLYTEREHEMEELKELHRQQRRMTLLSNMIHDVDLRNELQDSIQTLEKLLGQNLLLPSSIRDALISHLIGNSPSSARETSAKMAADWHRNLTAGNFSAKFEQKWKYAVINESLLQEEVMWTYWNSFFFSFTAITTIGFGHLSPQTQLGRFLCLLYSIFGVAFNGIVFAGLADLFSKQFMKKIDPQRYDENRRIVLDAMLYLIPGIVGFFVFPAVIFLLMEEDWSYIDSIYFAFITLSTIGFGDQVAGYIDLSTYWLAFYRVFITTWIIFGLGYLLMIITFIQNALRSKKIRMLDRKIAKLLKTKKINSILKVYKDIDKLGSILERISSIRGQNKSLKREDSLHTTKELRDSMEKSVSVGNLNLAFENDSELQTNDPIRKISCHQLPRHANEIENEVDSFDIFIHLAEAVLQKSESINELATSHDIEKNEISTDSVASNIQNKILGVSLTDLSRGSLWNSSTRRFSDQTLRPLSSLNNKAFNSHPNSPTSMDEKVECSKNEKIEDLLDLMSKVEKVLTQDTQESKGMKVSDQAQVNPLSMREKSNENSTKFCVNRRLTLPLKTISHELSRGYRRHTFSN